VTPDYRHSDRQFDGEGAGLYRVTIEPKTGNVTDVTIVRSTSRGNLDRNAVAALRQWRWKPNSWRVVDVPFIFGSASPSAENRARSQVMPSTAPGVTP
jgi:TonB family protein